MQARVKVTVQHLVKLHEENWSWLTSNSNVIFKNIFFTEEVNIPAFHCTQRKFMLPGKLNATRHHNQWCHCNYLPMLTCVSALLCNPCTGVLKTQTSELPNLENSDPKTPPLPTNLENLVLENSDPQIWKILTPLPLLKKKCQTYTLKPPLLHLIYCFVDNANKWSTFLSLTVLG